MPSRFKCFADGTIRNCTFDASRVRDRVAGQKRQPVPRIIIVGMSHDLDYSFLAVQRPLQPSARLYEPLPLLPDILPVAVSATPSAPTLAAR